MRASTIFALCLALLVGLAAAVVNRVVNQKAAPVAEAKAAPTQVLVAGRNIFAGAPSPSWVGSGRPRRCSRAT